MNVILPISLLASALTASSFLYFRFKHKATCPRCNGRLSIEAKRRKGPEIIYYCPNCNKRFMSGSNN